MSRYYHLLDQPSVLRNAFYPRKGLSRCPAGAFDLYVPVDDDVKLHCRFYLGSDTYPTILYFHGNGEIVSDYDGLVSFYHNLARANLAVAEFRGYGASSGTPTFSAMIEDAPRLFRAVQEELAQRALNSDLYLMGRSMGSVPALELAAVYGSEAEGLIIESGFTCAARIARRLGITLPRDGMELLEEDCRQKVQRITLPALVIHGEDDSLVPLQEAETLYGLLGTEQKKLLVIPFADHNSLIFEGADEYFAAIAAFVGGS